MSAETVFQSPNEIIPWSGPVFLPGTGMETPGYSERPGDQTHIKVDVMPALAFDTPDVTAISYSPPPLVVLEKPIVHSPRVGEVLLPPGTTDQQLLAELDGAVRSKHGISRVGFEAVWGGEDQKIHPKADQWQVSISPHLHDAIASVIPGDRPMVQSDYDVKWHKTLAEKAYARIARETGFTVDVVHATSPRDDLYEQIHANKRLESLFEKAHRHEKLYADAREKQAGVDQARADEQYAADHSSIMYEPERVARETALAAQDAKVAHILYSDGRPTQGVDFEGYAQTVDVNGKLFTATCRAHNNPYTAQDLALEAEEAIEAAAIAKNDLTKAQAGDNGTPDMGIGPLAAFVGGAFRVIDTNTEGIQNPAVRNAVRKAAKFTVGGVLAVAGASLLGGCAAPPTPQHAPTLPPPGGETSMPPTPHFPPEASSVISAPVEMVAALPDALPEPGKPQVVAGLSSVMPGQGEVLSTAPLDNHIALALNEQGVKPFFGKDDKGNSIFSADVSVDGKNVCLPAAPEQIANKNDPLQVFSYIPDGNVSPMVGFGSPDLLGKVGDSDNVIRYGLATNGQTDIAGILSPVLPSLENTDCAYGSVIDADKTPNPNDFPGAVVGVHFDKDGTIVAYNSPVLVDPSDATINVRPNGEILLDGQPMESRVWVGNATATPIPTFTPPPTSTPEPSATPQVERMIVNGKEVSYGILTDQQVIDVLNATRSDVPLKNAIFVSGVAMTNIIKEDGEVRLRIRIPTDNHGSVVFSVVFGPDDQAFFNTPCVAAGFDNLDINHRASPINFQTEDIPLVNKQVMLRVSQELATRTPPAACQAGWLEQNKLIAVFTKDVLAQAIADGKVIELGRAPRATVIYSSATK